MDLDPGGRHLNGRRRYMSGLDVDERPQLRVVR